jgi:hypothetical protein
MKEVFVTVGVLMFWTIFTGVLAGGGVLAILMVGFFYGCIMFYWLIILLAVLAKVMPICAEKWAAPAYAIIATGITVFAVKLFYGFEQIPGAHFSMVSVPIGIVVLFYVTRMALDYRSDKSSQ